MNETNEVRENNNNKQQAKKRDIWRETFMAKNGLLPRQINLNQNILHPTRPRTLPLWELVDRVQKFIFEWSAGIPGCVTSVLCLKKQNKKAVYRKVETSTPFLLWVFRCYELMKFIIVVLDFCNLLTPLSGTCLPQDVWYRYINVEMCTPMLLYTYVRQSVYFCIVHTQSLVVRCTSRGCALCFVPF